MWRTQGFKVSRSSSVQAFGFYLPREKPRRRATARERTAEPEREEPDLATAEDEVRRAREVAISAKSVFVSSAVDP